MGQPIIRYEKGDLYETLEDEYEVFDDLYDVVVFLAVIGYREDRVVRDGYTGSEADGTDGEAGLSNVRGSDLNRVITASLAFQDTGDPEAIVDDDEHRRVLAQYAAGGLRVAEERFGEVAGDPTDAIVNYIREKHEEDRPGGGDPILREIYESFDEELGIGEDVA